MEDKLNKIKYSYCVTYRETFIYVEKYGLLNGISTASALDKLHTISEIIIHNESDRLKAFK